MLMRTGHMPSRPMNMTALRRVALKGTVNANVRIDIDVSQAPGAARAQGSFRLADAGSTTVLEGTELGVLQTTKDWASFTARIRNRDDEGRGARHRHRRTRRPVRRRQPADRLRPGRQRAERQRDAARAGERDQHCAEAF